MQLDVGDVSVLPGTLPLPGEPIVPNAAGVGASGQSFFQTGPDLTQVFMGTSGGLGKAPKIRPRLILEAPHGGQGCPLLDVLWDVLQGSIWR